MLSGDFNTAINDAVSGLGYENVAESHGAEEVYGPYG
jgi:hypothetical protein